MLRNLNRIIFDTDPGIDDAIAIIVLLASRKEQIECVLSSYGNISIEKTTQNALAMLELCSCDGDIPVIIGSRKSQSKRYEDASHIHGADGLGGLNVAKTKNEAISGDWQKLVYERIISCGKVDYIAVGPLTNLAELVKRFPDVSSHIDRVVIMGGGFDVGNVTKHAEFNIYCDPVSADYVFKNLDNISLIPLNTSTTVAFSMEQIEEIGRIEAPLQVAAEKILAANYASCKAFGENGSTMHDATAVFYYLFPDEFEIEKCGVFVDCDEAAEINGKFGKTNKADEINSRKNVTVTSKVNEKAVLEYITKCIKSFI